VPRTLTIVSTPVITGGPVAPSRVPALDRGSLVGLFGSKNKGTEAPVPEPIPVLGSSDLDDAAEIMARWDASLGNSDATWDCLEVIARRGGFQGPQAALFEIMDGKPSDMVVNRPWRWWAEAAREASAVGRDELAGSIFLFTHLFATQMVDGMLPAHRMDIGLDRPSPESYAVIAMSAVRSLPRLPMDLKIHDTATGQVDVASALRMAESVAGVDAERPPATAERPPSSPESDWNTL